MHYLMVNPYISYSYMTYLVEEKEREEEGERGGEHNPISKQSINFD